MTPFFLYYLWTKHQQTKNIYEEFCSFQIVTGIFQYFAYILFCGTQIYRNISYYGFSIILGIGKKYLSIELRIYKIYL